MNSYLKKKSESMNKTEILQFKIKISSIYGYAININTITIVNVSKCQTLLRLLCPLVSLKK